MYYVQMFRLLRDSLLTQVRISSATGLPIVSTKYLSNMLGELAKNTSDSGVANYWTRLQKRIFLIN